MPPARLLASFLNGISRPRSLASGTTKERTKSTVMRKPPDFSRGGWRSSPPGTSRSFASPEGEGFRPSPERILRGGIGNERHEAAAVLLRWECWSRTGGCVHGFHARFCPRTCGELRHLKGSWKLRSDTPIASRGSDAPHGGRASGPDWALLSKQSWKNDSGWLPGRRKYI